MADTKAQADLSKITAKIQKMLRKAASPEELRAVGEEAARIIQVRARLGYGSPPGLGGTRFRHKGLSPGYVRFRERYRDLSSLTTPSRSNLTLTGQMLG